MDIKISRSHKTATVIDKGVMLKTQQLEPEEFKELMNELTDKMELDIDYLRSLTKMFKVREFTFKGIV